MRSLRIALKLTYRCLGRCSYCASRKKLWQARGGRDMPTDLLEACIMMLSNRERHPFQEIHLTGGEITLHPKFSGIARRLQSTGLPLSASSSGWGAKRGGWGELLQRVAFDKLYISLDHPEEKSNDVIRGPGSWGRATRAIKEARAVRDQLGKPEIVVASVIHRHNIRNLEVLLQILRDWGVDRWLPAHLEGSSSLPQLAPSAADWAWLNKRRAENPALNIALGEAFHPTEGLRHLITHGEWPGRQPIPRCTTIGRLAIVHPNGAIYPCYGSEYWEVSPIGKADEMEKLNFRQLLKNAAANPPDACRYCPEPIQNSQPLR